MKNIISSWLAAHPLVKSLVGLEGNPRITVLTEPLFGVPYNLFAPYASVYMLTLGLNDKQIGGIASISLVFQMFIALVSGAITDKFGRRRTLFIFDLLCWSLPCLIWAVAQDFTYFLVAALFNSLWRVSHTAWTCLMVEDAQPSQIHHIWVWVYIFALGSAFVSPLAGRLVKGAGLVPAMRGLYIFAFIVLTVKFVLLYIYSHETQRGRERREETRGVSLWVLLKEYTGVFRLLLEARATLAVMALMLVMAIFTVVNNSFWAIMVTEKLKFPQEHIGYFPLLRSVVMLAAFFRLIPHLDTHKFRLPLGFGFAGFLAAQLLLVTMPERNYPLLLLSVALEAFSTSVVSPLLDSLLVLTMNAEERARLTAIVFVGIIILSSPFGSIAGQLSDWNRLYPFILNIGLMLVGGLLVVFHRWSVKEG